MGKISKFFKSLIGFKTTTAPPPSRSDPNKQPKRRRSFVESRRDQPHHHRSNSKSLDGERHHHHYSSDCTGSGHRNEDPSKHAIALAAATAAVVDASVAAARAAAVAVRMTVRTTSNGGRRELAAVKIQSCFRAYLARKALRALKALVKLQALVRGHILRKHSADMMRRLQVLVRAQARARTGQFQIADSTHSTIKGSFHFHNHGPPTPKKYEHFARTRSTKHDHLSIPKMSGSKSYARGITDNENDKIVEVDTRKPHTTTRRRNLFQPDQINFGYSQNQSQSLTNTRGSTVQPTSSSWCAFCEVNSTEGSMRGGLSTPIKSDGSRSCINGYSDHPNYMSYTKSSRAKVRSLSAPRLRAQEETNATNMDLVYKYWSDMQSVSTKRDSFVSKGYRGSDRLDRLQIPVVGVNVGANVEESKFYGGYWN